MNELNSKYILIVRIGAVGDVLMATPLVSAIRKTFPDSYIGFLTSDYAMPLLQYNREINALYSIKHRKLPFWLSREKQRLTREMKNKKWDVIFLLESNPIFASLIKKFNAEAVYGFKGETDGYLTDSIPFSPDSHVISNFLKLGSLLGNGFNEFPMKLYWNDAATDRVKTILNNLPANYPKIAIHAGFGPSGKRGRKAIGVKSWPVDRFRETIVRLNKETGASFVLTGTAEEFITNESITKGLKFPILNLAGHTTIPELGALLKEMDMLISIDSSPAHIAAAVGTPLIVLWGPAIEIKMRPVSLNSPVVTINKNLPCSPCYETPRKDNCRNNICMKEIQVDEVVKEAIKLVSKIQSVKESKLSDTLLSDSMTL
ncbi:MAG: glycosyltransferase family 9 protein [Nitrospinae bacterium]|nr:glycosyltransferase family 9 protein [Nitrospinota bacterium]